MRIYRVCLEKCANCKKRAFFKELQFAFSF